MASLQLHRGPEGVFQEEPGLPLFWFKLFLPGLGRLGWASRQMEEVGVVSQVRTPFLFPLFVLKPNLLKSVCKLDLSAMAMASKRPQMSTL